MSGTVVHLPVPPALRAATPARVELGRAGGAQPTAARLELAAAHALARDAVHAESPRSLEGLDDAPIVRSRAADRREYLTRPYLGRLPDPGDLAALGRDPADVGVVVADGLSPAALAEHGPGLWRALSRALAEAGDGSWSVGAPVLAQQARVALADHVAEARGWETVIMVIGERPGLSVPHSLGLYITHRPHPGIGDGMRNCISNVHPPDGLGYRRAADIAVGLITEMRRLGMSGTAVKDMIGGADEAPMLEGTE
ncbi:ethanolamine ammonia-lyase subunit EutC [Corynebacterium sp. 335C]